MSTSSWPQFLGHEMLFLVRSNVMWNTMMVERAVYKFTDGSFMCRKSKSTPRVSVYFSKDKELLFPWQKWFNKINLPADRRLIKPRMVLYGGFSAGLCCGEFRHSAVVVARSAILRGSACSWAHVLLLSLLLQSLCSWTHWTVSFLAEERDWLLSTEWVSLFAWLLKSSSIVDNFCIYMGHKCQRDHGNFRSHQIRMPPSGTTRPTKERLEKFVLNQFL